MKFWTSALCLAALAIFASPAMAQSTTPPAGADKDLDLPFVKPTLPAEPPPPPPPEPEPEDPPEFFGEPIPTENSTIYYVIDCSCSMDWDSRSYVDDAGNRRNGYRIDRAKSELRKAVRSLPRTFRFNMLSYGCSVQTFRGGMVEANDANKAAALGWVNSRQANDATMTGPATAHALRQDRANKSVVLLTDGEPNCGANGDSGHRQAIRSANTQNAVVTVFGIGATGSLRQFCQDVARENSGRYVDVP